MSRAIRIIEPGLFTTVQDRGRYGFQRFGVPVSGAMDQFALRAANLLVGNDENAAALEMTVIGPTVEFDADAVIAVTGRGPVAHPRRLAAAALGSRPRGRGQQAIVPRYAGRAFAATLPSPGGIAVPEVMGSRSTYVKAGFGGLDGRALAKGDALDTLDPLGVPREMPDGFTPPVYGEEHSVRVILGPQEQAFGDGGRLNPAGISVHRVPGLRPDGVSAGRPEDRA